MQEQRMPGAPSRAIRSEEELDSLVLGLVLDSPSGLWSVHELGREIRDRVAAEDAVPRLEAAGLLHRLGEFVFATRAARRAGELQVGTV